MQRGNIATIAYIICPKYILQHINIYNIANHTNI